MDDEHAEIIIYIAYLYRFISFSDLLWLPDFYTWVNAAPNWHIRVYVIIVSFECMQ